MCGCMDNITVLCARIISAASSAWLVKVVDVVYVDSVACCVDVPRATQVYAVRWADNIATFNTDCRNSAQEQRLDVCLEEGN